MAHGAGDDGAFGIVRAGQVDAHRLAGADGGQVFCHHLTAPFEPALAHHAKQLGAGRHQMPLVTQAALMGGNVRVGLEDSLSVGAGKLATSNAEQVRLIRGVLETLGMEIATPAEARQMLGLKGRDKVRLN